MMDAQNLILYMAAALFVLGTCTFIAGVLILTLRIAGADVKTLADQTARLAHKGLVDDMAGLLGNASDLMDAMNQLVRTTRGIGVFFTLLGLFMMGAAAWLAIKAL